MNERRCETTTLTGPELGVQGCGVSGCEVSTCYVQNLSPISALAVMSPHLQFSRVDKLSCSNPTSSNTTSLNSRPELSHGSSRPAFLFQATPEGSRQRWQTSGGGRDLAGPEKGGSAQTGSAHEVALKSRRGAVQRFISDLKEALSDFMIGSLFCNSPFVGHS